MREPMVPRWMSLLADAHPGTCRWYNHPMHRVRNYAAWVLGKIAP